jgi:hypothetical protein
LITIMHHFSRKCCKLHKFAYSKKLGITLLTKAKVISNYTTPFWVMYCL